MWKYLQRRYPHRLSSFLWSPSLLRSVDHSQISPHNTKYCRYLEVCLCPPFCRNDIHPHILAMNCRYILHSHVFVHFRRLLHIVQRVQLKCLYNMLVTVIWKLLVRIKESIIMICMAIGDPNQFPFLFLTISEQSFKFRILWYLNPIILKFIIFKTALIFILGWLHYSFITI